jgi:hypothetical protein
LWEKVAAKPADEGPIFLSSPIPANCSPFPAQSHENSCSFSVHPPGKNMAKPPHGTAAQLPTNI